MPIEDIQTQKAPKGWAPSPDQRRRVETDPRLQRMSNDELYFFFNQRARDAAQGQGGRAAPPASQRKAASGGPASGLFGWVDSITEALRGR